MTVETIQAKGQVAVPKEVRDGLGVKPGDEVTWIQDADGRSELCSGPGPSSWLRSMSTRTDLFRLTRKKRTATR